jgi:hypothetical protein
MRSGAIGRVYAPRCVAGSRTQPQAPPNIPIGGWIMQLCAAETFAIGSPIGVAR